MLFDQSQHTIDENKKHTQWVLFAEYCSQQSNFRSKSELGFMIGGSYYIGDLNQYKHFYNTQLAGGLVYRYNVHSRLSVRGNFNYGKVKASDADSKLNIMQNRNLNFESTYAHRTLN